MAVRIRLTRTGHKNHALWRIAVFDKRTRRDGRYLEKLGTYDPHKEKVQDKVEVDMERYNHWISTGARPSDSVERLLKHTGHLEKK